jgi:hypothetical protein
MKYYTLQEQGQECDEKHQENRNNAATNPVKDRNQVVASWLSTPYVTLRVYFADQQLFVQCTQV